VSDLHKYSLDESRFQGPEDSEFEAHWVWKSIDSLHSECLMSRVNVLPLRRNLFIARQWQRAPPDCLGAATRDVEAPECWSDMDYTSTPPCHRCSPTAYRARRTW
jgi:hypothetical protein